MWVSTSMARLEDFAVQIKPATTYERRDGEYGNYPDPSSLWLGLNAGVESVSVRMTPQQANKVYHALGAYLQDMQRQEHPETVQGEAEAIDVIDPEQTMTAAEIKAGINAGMEAERERR